MVVDGAGAPEVVDFVEDAIAVPGLKIGTGRAHHLVDACVCAGFFYRSHSFFDEVVFVNVLKAEHAKLLIVAGLRTFVTSASDGGHSAACREGRSHGECMVIRSVSRKGAGHVTVGSAMGAHVHDGPVEGLGPVKARCSAHCDEARSGDYLHHFRAGTCG